MEFFSATAIPFWTAIAALAAVVTACVTSIYTYLTLRLFRAQAEPKVIIYARQEENQPSFLQLVIENIGKGVAYDVEFVTSSKIKYKAFANAPDKLLSMDTGPVVHGIPVLEPGGSRVITWGEYKALLDAIGDEQISVTVKYFDGKRKMQETGILDLRTFRNIAAHDPPLVKIERHLHEIKEIMESLLKLESTR